jgi:glycosyltransferase involved in cell wall biosynthesis
LKKIVILVDQLNSHGGIEKLVSVKANYWAEVFQYEVTVIATEQYQKPLVYSLSDKVKFIDLAINYNRTKSYFSPANVLKFLRNIWLIQSYILKNKPDFINVASHIPITYFLPFLVAKAKTMKEFHFTKFSRPLVGFKAKVLNYIEGKYDYLIVLSNEERQFYPSPNAVVIANPIEHLSQVASNYSQNENIALFVGRPAPVKQLEKLVAVWVKFIQQKPHWELHLFGSTDDDYSRKIQQLVVENAIQDSFIFKGQSNKIAEELAKAKVLLLTSEQECFPMVILESHAAGIPVVSFDSPTGPRNIIHNNIDGILVEYNNIDSFVQTLVRFDEEITLQNLLSKNAAENAKNYHIDTIMNRWNDLIFTK